MSSLHVMVLVHWVPFVPFVRYNDLTNHSQPNILKRSHYTGTSRKEDSKPEFNPAFGYRIWVSKDFESKFRWKGSMAKKVKAIQNNKEVLENTLKLLKFTLSSKFKVCTEASDWKNLEFCESLIERLKTMCGSWFGSSMRNLHSRVSLLSAVPSTRSPNSPTCWLCVAANLLTQPRVDWLTISIRRLKFLGKIVTN